MDLNARFRLTGASRRSPEVDAWISRQSETLRPIVKIWFEHIRTCGNDVRELLHDGHPTACVGDIAFAYVNAFQHHVNVGFFNGMLLSDPAGILEGSGKRMRHVKLLPGQPVDETALARLIEESYRETREFIL